jgi:hypothetical protein
MRKIRRPLFLLERLARVRVWDANQDATLDHPEEIL